MVAKTVLTDEIGFCFCLAKHHESKAFMSLDEVIRAYEDAQYECLRLCRLNGLVIRNQNTQVNLATGKTNSTC